MSPVSVTCPECKLSFAAPAAGQVNCPICDTVVPVRRAAAHAPFSAAPIPVARPMPVGLPPGPIMQAQPNPQAPLPRVAKSQGSRKMAVIILGGVGFLLLVGAALGAYILTSVGSEGSTAAKKDADRTEPTKPLGTGTGNGSAGYVAPAVREDRPSPEKQNPPPRPEPVEIARANPLQPPPPRPTGALTQQQKRINLAIDRGAAYVKQYVQAFHRDELRIEQFPEGVISLMGLTLLSCGVPTNDLSMIKIADALRASAPRLSQTYSLATAVLFLDRLGNPRYQDLIQTFSMRLVAGQLRLGNWTYNCPILTPKEELQLISFLKSRQYMNPENPSFKDADFDTLTAALPDKLKALPVAQKRNQPALNDVLGDNSNTQFAVLALWVAKRQALPVQPALTLLDRYFRTTQNDDGSWCYVTRNMQWKGSMTCSGLLGLAIGRTAILQVDKKNARREKDPEIEKGLRFLAKTIAAPRFLGSTGQVIGADAHGDLYYLFSLERVAMIFDLHTIGGKDWYAWASKVLLDTQKPDGSWEDLYPGSIDTCFALLVLKRVNVVEDLTANIKETINIKDIGGQR